MNDKHYKYSVLMVLVFLLVGMFMGLHPEYVPQVTPAAYVGLLYIMIWLSTERIIKILKQKD